MDPFQVSSEYVHYPNSVILHYDSLCKYNPMQRLTRQDIVVGKRSARRTVVGVLETGLLFREDALQLEDGLQVEDLLDDRKTAVRYLENVRFSPAERVFSVVAVGICIAVLPLRRTIGVKENIYRSLLWASVGIATPLLHRLTSPFYFVPLAKCCTEYTYLIRKCISSMKCQFFSDKQGNISSLNSLLIQQQKELCLVLLNINTELESLFSWLPASSSWEFPICDDTVKNADDMTKMHNLFLVLQSTFLKNVALAHLTPPRYTVRLHKNNNEKLYWIHSEVFPVLLECYNNLFVALDKAYVRFKDSLLEKKDRSSQNKPQVLREPWKYAELHSNIVLCSAEIRSALTKCNDMDTFLEACWKANSQLSSQVFEDDLLKLREELVKCFNTVEIMSGQLKKIKQSEMEVLERAVQKLQLPAVEEEECENINTKVVSEETEVAVEDQVFYYVKSEGDTVNETLSADNITAPGKEEIKNNKYLLEELKVKLIKREDEMRERESIALENTMPELKGKIPTFPSQLKSKDLPVDSNSDNGNDDTKVVTANEAEKIQPLIVNGNKEDSDKTQKNSAPENLPSIDDAIEGPSANGDEDDAVVEDFDAAPDGTEESEEDSDNSYVLKDVRKNRVAKKKRNPSKWCQNGESKEIDGETSVNLEYKLGTNLAMASLFNSELSAGRDAAKFIVAGETFIGDGEVSSDSGNET